MRFKENLIWIWGTITKQIIGANMAAIPSPEIWNVKIYQAYQHIVMQFRHASTVLFHEIYRDECFIIFNDTIEEIEEFFHIGNHCHKNLQFTFEFQPSVNLLDIVVNRFNESLYVKIDKVLKSVAIVNCSSRF